MLSQSINPQTKLSDIPQHCYIKFTQYNEPDIFFNSQFDSGNLNKVIKNTYDHYSVWTASDAQGTENIGYPKSWFYFQVGGFCQRKILFSIHRIHFLWALVNKSHLYRPVYRIKQSCSPPQNETYGEWKRLPYPIQSITINSQQQLILKFDFYFLSTMKSVQFAFIYPYGHEQCHTDMVTLKNEYENDEDIFLKNYQLCRSYQGRVIDMLLISSHDGKDGLQNVKTDNIFHLGQKKLQKYKNYKPVIFISSRVHPIQTPSSYTMNGIIKYLLDKNDYRAHLLRKYFVFILVPMLNPDGVSNGHCRMDSLNQNLNRYYHDPDPIKQPSCYSVMKLCQFYNKQQKLFMYLDLHAHPANKGNFIFGNAIFDYIQQVESHLFPKVLSQNCINFQFQQCNFSRKHMKAKDKNQDMNKQGCGRVVFHKQFGLTHSYTLQCGYHCNTYNNTLLPQQNANKIYIARYKTTDRNQNIYDNYEQIIIQQQQRQQVIKAYIQKLKQKKNNHNYKIFYNVTNKLDCLNDQYYQAEFVFFDQQTYQNLGRNICISLLDIWNKNPYTRISNLNQLRIQIAQKQAKLDRFRKQQVGIKTKQKKIIELIQNQLYSQWYKKNIFQTQTNIQNGFKKKLLKTSLNVQRCERIDKSVTIAQSKQQKQSKESTTNNTNISTTTKQLSIGKLPVSRNGMRSKKQTPKQQKKIGVIQSNIESMKSKAQFIKYSTPLKITLDARSFFKPVNLKIRNFQFTGK